MTPWWIYVLIDPRDGRVRYVGKTERPKNRLASHLSPSRFRQQENHRTAWIGSLLRSGLKPIFKLIDAGIGDGWAEAERAWISEFRANGADLVNGTDGGEGTMGRRVPLSPEHRAKIGAANRGKKRTPEMCEANRQRNLGRSLSEESRKKMSAAARGKKKTPEHRAKIGAANRRAALAKKNHELTS